MYEDITGNYESVYDTHCRVISISMIALSTITCCVNTSKYIDRCTRLNGQLNMNVNYTALNNSDYIHDKCYCPSMNHCNVMTRWSSDRVSTTTNGL